MKRHLPLIITLIVCTSIVAYVVSKCPNFLKHYDHTKGVAYFKQGPIKIFPYEIDAPECPFNVTGGVKDSAILNSGIFIDTVGRDSIDVRFRIKQKVYRYTLKLSDTISNEYFSIVTHPAGSRRDTAYKRLYYFEFVKYVPIEHPSGIGYYTRTAEKSSPRDISDSPPFEVLVAYREDEILKIPVYVRMLEDDKAIISFSIDGRDYAKALRLGENLKNRYFSCTFRPKRHLTEADLKQIYYFKFER